MAQNHDDLTILSVRSAVDHLKSTVNRALQRIERKHQLDNAEVLNQVKERRKLAKSLDLDKRVIELYKTLTSKPVLKADSGPTLIHCDIDNAVVVQEGNDQIVSFLLNGQQYHLKFADRGGACISYFGETFKSTHLTLLEGAQEVFNLHLDLEGEGDEERITLSQITAFVPGKWIYDVIHAYETLNANKNLKQIYNAYSPESIELLKTKFGIAASSDA